MEPTNVKLYNPRIDQLRAVGFMSVATVHFFNPGFHSVLEAHFPTRMLLPLIDNGQFGVSLFFFISGYILSRLATEQGGTVDYKNFLINRLFRIYPVWLVCVAIIAMTAKLGGGDLVALLALFTQNLPLSPFNIAWSVQLEMYLYLLFPILFLNVRGVRELMAVVSFFFLLRAMMYFVPAPLMVALSYFTILGAIPVFVLGILSGKMPRWDLGRARLPALVGTVILIWGVGYLIKINGGLPVPNFAVTQPGYAPGGPLAEQAKWLWLLYPEIMALCFFLLVNIYDSKHTPLLDHHAAKWFGRMVALIGKISYSGYMFHIFVIDFFIHARASLGLERVHAFIQFAVFLLILFPVAFISYKVVEEPFLRMRKSYIRRREATQSPK
jgi:peptidoglycan/LPS O-acetylase OafA/YrhL